MKTIFAIFTLLIVAIFSIQSFSQNIAINQTGAAANASAILDVNATNKGLLIPRVALQSTTDGTTVTSPATSLMVYSQGGVLTDGYYYNSGTSGSPVWSLLVTPSTLSTTGCADACSWTLVAVGNSTIGFNGGSISTGYTLSSAKEVLLVLVYAGPEFTLATSDNPGIFEITATENSGSDNEFMLNCPACPTATFSTYLHTTIVTTKIKGRRYNVSGSRVRISPTMATGNFYAEMDGTGLIYLFDSNGAADIGMYIFER